MTTLDESAMSTTGHERSIDPEAVIPGARLVVEYWTVNMDGQESCGSCDQTLAVLGEAVEEVRSLAVRVGVAVTIQLHTIATWAEALDHQIVASPTIRAAGIELRPSHTDESETRLWTWHGTVTTSATYAAIVDFLIRAVAARSQELDRYLTAGGPARYVRQHLQPTQVLPQSSAEATPESAACRDTARA